MVLIQWKTFLIYCMEQIKKLWKFLFGCTVPLRTCIFFFWYICRIKLPQRVTTHKLYSIVCTYQLSHHAPPRTLNLQEPCINDRSSVCRWNAFLFSWSLTSRYKLSITAILLQKSISLTVTEAGCAVGGLPKTETSKESGLMELHRVGDVLATLRLRLDFDERYNTQVLGTYFTKGNWEVTTHSFREPNTSSCDSCVEHLSPISLMSGIIQTLISCPHPLISTHLLLYNTILTLWTRKCDNE